MDAQGKAGFTLLELLIVVALVAILAALAAPSLSGLVERSHTRAIADQLQSQLMLARTQGVIHQRDVVICGSTDGLDCDDDGWSRGWLVRQHHSVDETLISHALDGKRRIGWKGPAAAIRFVANGTAPLGNGRFFICDITQQVAWQLVVSRQGRVRRVQGLEPGQSAVDVCL